MFNKVNYILGIGVWVVGMGASIYMCVKSVQKCKSDIAVNQKAMEVLNKCDTELIDIIEDLK